MLFLSVLLWYGNPPVARLGFPVGGFIGHILNRSGNAESCEIGLIGLVPWMFLSNAALDALLDAVLPFDYSLARA